MGGQLQETKGIENMISVVYTEGPELSASLVKHLNEYEIDILENRRVVNIDKQERFVISMKGGEKVLAKKIILATGAKWRELNVPGKKN